MSYPQHVLLPIKGEDFQVVLVERPPSLPRRPVNQHEIVSVGKGKEEGGAHIRGWCRREEWLRGMRPQLSINTGEVSSEYTMTAHSSFQVGLFYLASKYYIQYFIQKTFSHHRHHIQPVKGKTSRRLPSASPQIHAIAMTKN